jgi:16S rRNA processing protein RimM
MSADKKRPAGSPTAGGPAYLAAGKVRRPHGVHGEMVVEIYTDFPERLQPGKTVYIGAEHTCMTVASQRSHNEGLLLGFEGITTPEQASRYRNQVLSISASDAQELPDGVYFFHELLGLNVTDESDRALGTLTEIIKTGANDVYVVTDAAGVELLLPAIPEVVLNVDLDEKTMKVHVLPGLMDDETLDS